MPGSPEAVDATPAVIDGCRGFPLRPSKYELPALPDETLRRDRLLDWLNVKIHRRAIFVVAEAGYGKTTLLADFARRTRMRVAWYRLDEDETDALVFLRYLIAACRQMDPNVLSGCAEMLQETPAGPPPWETILQTLLTEIGAFAAEPTIVFFDDYHYAERLPAIREITEQLLAKAPERVTFVFASRRQPRLSVARLRVRDELAELTRDELRFDEAETEQLFRETYNQPLEPEVLHDLMGRTEGWPASLQLVKEAVRRRTRADTKAFIRALSGAEGDLYDYLAEEVVSDLDPKLREFLQRTALLDEVDAEISAAVSDLPPAEAASLISVAEAHGLLSKPAVVGGPRRFHPLVRGFLYARLASEVGDAAIIQMHREIARIEEPRSWRRAGQHWLLAGEIGEVQRVTEDAVSEILGTGDYEAAEELIIKCAPETESPYFDIIRSRLALARGQFDEALQFAARASSWHGLVRQGAPKHEQLVVLNDAHIAAIALTDADEVRRLLSQPGLPDLDEQLRAIAKALYSLAAAVDTGALEAVRADALDVAVIARRNNQPRYEAISYLNVACADVASGEYAAAAAAAAKALELLGADSAPHELAAAHGEMATAFLRLGQITEAEEHRATAANLWPHPVVLGEQAYNEALFGDPTVADALIAQADRGATSDDPVVGLARAHALGSNGEFDRALEILQGLERCRPFTFVAFHTAVASAYACIALSAGRPDAAPSLARAIELAERQGAWHYVRIARLAEATSGTATLLSKTVVDLANRGCAVSAVPDLVVPRLSDLEPAALRVISTEVATRPFRWRPALRRFLNLKPARASLVAAAALLETVGEPRDIPLLRGIASSSRTRRASSLGRDLIRRLAQRYEVEDLGPVAIRSSARFIEGGGVRRKVLALLCYLLTRPRFACTREQAMDALWPGSDPTTAGNSLNQTVYFLRRVFEPEFDESLSPGYVRSEGEVISLDSELVTAKSLRCVRLIEQTTKMLDAGLVLELSNEYTSRFALDFSYDEWSCAYRDTLHASFLRVIEQAVLRDTDAGEFDRAIAIAERAIRVDPDADQVEVSLLHLYRVTGAYAAAAEQYGHYAGILRHELGAEPPDLETL